MGQIGKFIIKKFKGKPINIFTSNENEYIHYADTDMFSWTLIKGVVVDYDVESGVITLQSLTSKKLFYLNEFKVELFWDDGVSYQEFIGDTINGRKSKDRDIM